MAASSTYDNDCYSHGVFGDDSLQMKRYSFLFANLKAAFSESSCNRSWAKAMPNCAAGKRRLNHGTDRA
jgi:hypothetical protein